jgi:NitT/TauT family transport system permease protein
MTATAQDVGAGATVAAERPRPRAPALLAWRIAGYAVFLMAWQLVSTYLIASHIVPSPVTIAREMISIVTSGGFATHLGATMTRTFVALPIVFVLGAIVGVAMGRNRWAEAAFRDAVNVVLSVPGLIIVLIAVLVFGLSWWGPIVAVVITNLPFVTVQVWEGVKSLPADLVDMATSYRVRRSAVLRHVVIPALAPYLFTAFTYAFTLTWKLVMLSELFGASSGVGFKMRAAFWEFSMAGVVAWALWLYVIALLIERLVLQRLATRFFRWRQSSFD